MDTTAIVAVAGLAATLAGTFGAPYFANRQAARYAQAAQERAIQAASTAAIEADRLASASAQGSELRAARAQLYVDIAEYVHNGERYLDWLTEDYRVSRFFRRESTPSSIDITGRVLLLAPQPVRDAWTVLLENDEALGWNLREGGDHDELGSKAEPGGSDVLAVRAAHDRVLKAARAAMGVPD